MPLEKQSDMAGEFDGLRRLLALKRRELPPPGFFNDFATRVIFRIESEELARQESPWWRRSFGLSTARILAGANLLTVCGLAFVGVSLYLVLSGEIEPVAIASAGWRSSNAPVAAGFGTLAGGLARRGAAYDLSLGVPFSAELVPSDLNSTNESTAEGTSISPQAADSESEREAARALFKLGTTRVLNPESVAVPTYRMVVPR